MNIHAVAVFRAAVLGLAALVLGGCAGLFGGPKLTPAPVAAATPDYRYLVGAGDTLNIVVWRNPELSMQATVRPDGRITVPLVEDLPVLGKDTSTIAREIEKALAKYIQSPIVTVMTTGFTGPYSEQVRVVGAAAKPQSLAYRQNMTLLDVMIAVGGMTDFADGNKAKILRTIEGSKEYSIRIRDLLKRGDMSANVEVKPGDVVIIPESWF